MTTLLRVSTRKAMQLRTTTRALFLFLGASMIVMEMTNPPVKQLWLVMGLLIPAVLIMYSIVGLTPRFRVSGFGEVLNNTLVHTTVSFVLGAGVIIAAMINPPVNMMWFAYFNLIGILLVFDAIITTSWNYRKQKKQTRITSSTKPIHH